MSNRHGAYEGPLFSYLERPEPIRSRLWRRANFALTEFSEVRATLRRLSLLRTDHQHGAVGMAHNRVRDATHQRSSYSPEPPTTHHDQVRSELLGQGHDLQSHLPHPEVSPCHGAPGGLHPQRLFPEPLLGLLFDLLVEACHSSRESQDSSSGKWAPLRRAPRATRSRSHRPTPRPSRRPVRLLRSRRWPAGSSPGRCSSRYSPFPSAPHGGTCTDCIKALVCHKGAEMARCRLRRATEAYSPECVEGEFSEVCCNGVFRS